MGKWDSKKNDSFEWCCRAGEGDVVVSHRISGFGTNVSLNVVVGLVGVTESS